MQHWQQFIFLIVAFGAPAASWAVGKLREQYEKKRRADANKVREEESIRVQRSAERLEQPSPQVQAQRRMEELAAKRQAQLEELRKRRAGATVAPEQRPVVVRAPTAPVARVPAQGPMRPGMPGVPTRIPGPGVPRPGAPQTAPAQTAARPARTAAQQAPQRPRPATTRTTPVSETRPSAAPKIAQVAASIAQTTGAQRRRAARLQTPGERARAMLVGTTADPVTTVAVAFALSEILARPVALRDDHLNDRS